MNKKGQRSLGHLENKLCLYAGYENVQFTPTRMGRTECERVLPPSANAVGPGEDGESECAVELPLLIRSGQEHIRGIR